MRGRVDLEDALRAQLRLCSIVVLGFWLVAFFVGWVAGAANPAWGWIILILWPISFVVLPLCACAVLFILIRSGLRIADQIQDERQRSVARTSGLVAASLVIGGSLALLSLGSSIH